MANKKTKRVGYSEPAEYIPKEKRDKNKGKDASKKKVVKKGNKK